MKTEIEDRDLRVHAIRYRRGDDGSLQVWSLVTEIADDGSDEGDSFWLRAI